MAERVGFEPTEPCGSTDFESVPFQIPKRGKRQNQHDRDEYGQLYHLKCLVFFHMKFPFRAFCAFATIPPSGVLWTAGGYNYKSFKKIT